ncbi:hypothetical protein HN51_005320 [Arachis hypogaea]|nr:uncharacterized protein DS421_4g125870 [Arachis hypogaea]
MRRAIFVAFLVLSYIFIFLLASPVSGQAALEGACDSFCDRTGNCVEPVSPEGAQSVDTDGMNLTKDEL